MRRVLCPDCGVVVEQVPWGEGKCRQATSYRWFLARWARRLAWQEVASIFQTSWDTVFRAEQYAVQCGLAHRDESGVTALGIDEIAWQKELRYLTLVYQIDAGKRRLLWMGTERTEKALHQFFDLLGNRITPTLKYVCSDMWQPYLHTIRARAGRRRTVDERWKPRRCRLDNDLGKSRRFVDYLRVQGRGGLLQGSQSEVNIRHSTITENQARFAGAGVFVEYPTVRIGDSIIAGNQVLDTGEFVDVDGDPNVAITVVSEGNNLIGSATTADASAALAAKSAFFAEESAGVA